VRDKHSEYNYIGFNEELLIKQQILGGLLDRRE
jgi:hypothetical protein